MVNKDFLEEMWFGLKFEEGVWVKVVELKYLGVWILFWKLLRVWKDYKWGVIWLDFYFRFLFVGWVDWSKVVLGVERWNLRLL